MSVTLQEIKEKDLPLILAWRNHPLIYQGFYEQGHLGKGPITWEEHKVFWVVPPYQEVFMIHYKGRDVGLIWTWDRGESSEIGIFIGEVTLHGQGVGREALQHFVSLLDNRKLLAKILKNNEKSMRLFWSCGFERIGESREGEWLYELER